MNKIENKNFLDKEFVDEQNKILAPMGLQLNSLLTHPTCTKEICYCGQYKCYYSPLWEEKDNLNKYMNDKQ